MIVMVTNLYEAGKIKCEQYWPSKEEKEKQYGPFTIKLRKEMNYPDYSLRTMEIKVNWYKLLNAYSVTLKVYY